MDTEQDRDLTISSEHLNPILLEASVTLGSLFLSQDFLLKPSWPGCCHLQPRVLLKTNTTPRVVPASAWKPVLDSAGEGPSVRLKIAQYPRCCRGNRPTPEARPQHRHPRCCANPALSLPFSLHSHGNLRSKSHPHLRSQEPPAGVRSGRCSSKPSPHLSPLLARPQLHEDRAAHPNPWESLRGLRRSPPPTPTPTAAIRVPPLWGWPDEQGMVPH